jgi:hypothetical protein
MSKASRFLGSPAGLITCLALAVAGAYLLLTHTGHALAALPYLALLACPLMHLFHRSHHGHAHRHGPDGASPRPPDHR